MAWTKTQNNGYDIYTETDLVLADNAGTNAGVVTVTSVLPDGVNWEDKKFPVTVDMTTVAGAAVVCDAILQTSTTGTTSDDVIGTASAATPSWVDSVALNINVGSATTTNYSIECDTSDVFAPYARLALTAAATDLTDAAGRCSIIFAHKPSKPNSEGLSGSDIGGDGTTGVGPDPS
tara:strand:+ start:143 stop:673 length:531 start_codon:yes stop_codon:yes gene_type:complete